MIDFFRNKDHKIMIDSQLLDILACPLSKQKLVYSQDTNELICEASKLAYPIRDGIPILLIEEARNL